MVHRLLSFLLLLCLTSYRTSHALSNGAAACEGGKAAVSGLHTSSHGVVLTGPLSMDDIEFQINGQALQPGVPFDITIGVDYEYKLITAGTFFRGFLVRLDRGDGNVDTRYALEPEEGYTAKIAETSCVNSYLVGGVTHTSNALKDVEKGRLTVHLPSQNMPLDVTVVIQNRNGYSIYYYSQFTLHASPPKQPNDEAGGGGGDADKEDAPTWTPYYPPPTGAPSKDPNAEAEKVPVPVTAPPTPLPTPPPTPLPTPPPTPSPTNPPTPGPSPPPTPMPNPGPTPPPTPNPTTLPTPPPSPAPTTPPTPAPVTQYLFLRYPTCSDDSPCTVCQGDCDSDDECAGALECFHRPQDDTSPVSGCAGIGVAGRDYCYPPQPNSLRPRMPECDDEYPCAACYGDCDEDSHCLPGLQCFSRGPGELTPIFGCSGLGIAGLDYCYDAAALDAAVLGLGDDSDREDAADNSTATIVLGNLTAMALTNVVTEAVTVFNGTVPSANASKEDSQDEDFSSSDTATPELVSSAVRCSSTSPCSNCEGHCDGDNANCGGSMECFVRPINDITIVPGCLGTGKAGNHYCWNPEPNTLSIRTTECTDEEPCQKCQGECDKDDDCMQGLACYQRQDLSPVPGCGNGFRSVNFCWDPNDHPAGRRLLRH